MSYGDDEEDAYCTSEDMVGRSMRRGTKKELKAAASAAAVGVEFTIASASSLLRADTSFGLTVKLMNSTNAGFPSHL